MNPTLRLLAVAAVEAGADSTLAAAHSAVRRRERHPAFTVLGPGAFPPGPHDPPVGPADPLLVLRPPPPQRCLHCRGRRLQKWGRLGRRQRYRCSRCGRTFNELTATSLNGLRRKDLWPAFCRCMIGGLTVRMAAARLGVHRDTAFRWRHRLLSELRTSENHPLGPTIDAGWTFVHRRYRVVLALDDRGRAAGAALNGRRLHPDAVRQLLEGRLEPGSTLVSNEGEFASVARYARTAGVPWLRRRQVDRRFDDRIERVRWHGYRFRGWLVRFRGVAERYLGNYLAWFRLVDGRTWYGVCATLPAPARIQRPR